jgi:hypothetical protein
MSNDSAHDDAEIIHNAYAERVSESFKVFAENLSAGQSEQACKDHFKRTLLLLRKIRDLALRAAVEGDFIEPGAADTKLAAEVAEPLSAEDQALVDSALAGTTGHAPAPPPAPRYRG